jgi:hypothetical protein
MHGSMRRREATNASRASASRAAAETSRRPYKRDQREIGWLGSRKRPGVGSPPVSRTSSTLPSVLASLRSFCFRTKAAARAPAAHAQRAGNPDRRARRQAHRTDAIAASPERSRPRGVCERKAIVRPRNEIARERVVHEGGGHNIIGSDAQTATVRSAGSPRWTCAVAG